MGKIYKLSDKNGNVLYPMTIGDAIAVDGATLTKKITTEATQTTRGMMSAEDKKKLDGIATGATANTGTVTGVTIKAGTGIAVDDQTEITTSGERIISLATVGTGGTYNSVTVDAYGRVTSGTNSNYVTLDGNQALTNKTYNGYTLAAACAKAVDEATMSSSSTNLPTSKAVAAYVDGALVSVLKYQGTVTSTSGLPASHKVGYVYVVAQAGTYAGKSCEVGDYIICKTAGSTANDAHWDVINGENQVTDSNPTLNWGTKSTVATVDGTDIHVTMPSNPAANKEDKITVKGILKGVENGGVVKVVAAVAGTDYLTPVNEVTTPTVDTTPDSSIICEVTQTKSGQIAVKKSRFSIGKSVPANAQFTDTTYNVVTTSANGLMSKEMLQKLNTIEEGATKIVATAVTSTEYTDSTILSIITGA